MAITLERPQIILPTATGPVLEETPRHVAIGGSSQDSAITVIENPITTDGQFLGLLFAKQFIARNADTRFFQDTAYFRLDLHGSMIAESSNPWQVNIKQGRGLSGRPLHYLETLGMGSILPNRSELPYELAFLPEGLYEGLLRQFSSGNAFPDAIKDVNAAIARRVSSFKMDASGNLSLPPRYASVPPRL